MTYRCLVTIIRDIINCYPLELLHIMRLPWRGCWRHCLSILLSLPNNQQPYGLFFHINCIPHWSGDFLQYYCCLCCHCCYCILKSMMLCGCTCHNYYIPLAYNLPLLLLLFFSLVINIRTFSSDSSFSCVFLPISYVFQNKNIIVLKYSATTAQVQTVDLF